MEVGYLNKKIDTPSIGVLYQTHNHDLERLYEKYKNNFIFTDSFDQYSFFLCDSYIVEDKSFVPLWGEFINIKCFDDLDEMGRIEHNCKNEDLVYYLIKKRFLQNFKSSPVNLYSSLRSGGKSHYRKTKNFGLYIPKDDYTDSMILSSDLGKLFRACSDKLVQHSKENEIENFLVLSSSIIMFCRENRLIEENPLYLYGINLCIKKSLDIMVNNENLKFGDLLLSIKNITELDDQMDTEVLLHCFICIISDIGFSTSFSSLFLNVYFTDVRFSLINSRLELDSMVSLSSKDKELILNHAYAISSLFKKIRLGDEAFLSAINQHHGSVSGKGFSDIFRTSIPKINIKFIAAQKISQVFLELRPNEPMEHAISSLKESIKFLPLRTEIEKLYTNLEKLFSNC